VRHQALELVFGAVRRKVGNLGFETAHQIGCGIDNACAKVIDLAGIPLESRRKLGGFRVQAHAQQGVVLALGGAQHI
jgi:hypothetical protein